MARAYVLLSGGIDSSTCLAMAKDKYKSVKAISVHYGQRHEVELAHATSIAEHFKVEHDVVNMNGLVGKGGLTDTELEVPKVDYEDLPSGVSPTYVPNRNMLMIAMLVSQAAADVEGECVMYGAHAEDAENDAYPDCSEEFASYMRKAITIATYGKIFLATPFITRTKADVVTVGDELEVPWALTWSCYEGGVIHCGECSTCRARRSAFVRSNVLDPTDYAVTPTLNEGV